MRSNRWTRPACLIAIASAINVLVAWSLCVFGPLRWAPGSSFDVSPEGHHLWATARPVDFPPSATREMVWTGPGLNYTLVSAGAAKVVVPQRIRAYWNGTAWIQRDVREFEFPAHLRRYYVLRELQAGWPARAFSAIQWRDADLQLQLHGGFQLSTEWIDPKGRIGTKLLPHAPRWGGLCLNTGFYALMIVLIWSPVWLRRLIRVRRRRCPRCAYPMGSSPVCTECGQNLS